MKQNKYFLDSASQMYSNGRSFSFLGLMSRIGGNVSTLCTDLQINCS